VGAVSRHLSHVQGVQAVSHHVYECNCLREATSLPEPLLLPLIESAALQRRLARCLDGSGSHTCKLTQQGAGIAPWVSDLELSWRAVSRRQMRRRAPCSSRCGITTRRRAEMHGRLMASLRTCARKCATQNCSHLR
jgi:hypothetical protein